MVPPVWIDQILEEFAASQVEHRVGTWVTEDDFVEAATPLLASCFGCLLATDTPPGVGTRGGAMSGW